MTATISNEDLVGDNQEIELVHYYKLRDFGQLLSAANIVEQEQWELKIPKAEENLFGGTFRVRKERGRGETEWQYTATTKTVVPGKPGKEEKTREIDESFFNTFNTRGAFPPATVPLNSSSLIHQSQVNNKVNNNHPHIDCFFSSNSVGSFPSPLPSPATSIASTTSSTSSSHFSFSSYGSVAVLSCSINHRFSAFIFVFVHINQFVQIYVIT